jgi:hypothetical protein
MSLGFLSVVPETVSLQHQRSVVETETVSEASGIKPIFTQMFPQEAQCKLKTSAPEINYRVRVYCPDN